MTTGQRSALISPRGIALQCVVVLLAIVALVGCQAAAERPIVYTAPPEVLAARTFRPVASASGAQSAAPSGGPSSSGQVGHPERGGIVFGTAVGTDSCSVTNPSRVLLSTQPFFFAAYLTDQQDGSKSIVLHIEKDGVTLADHQEPADGKAFDCYGNTSPLGTLAAGAYGFQVLQGTKLEAAGSVTVR